MPAPKAELFDQVARVAKALANGTRLELLDLLAQAERPVEALARAAGQGLTTVSANLQILKAVGVVAIRREGTRVYYRLAGPDIAALYASLRDVAGCHLADVELARRASLGSDGDVALVGREELERREPTGQLVVLDVRPAEEYVAGHIPGAIGIPLGELADRIAELPDGVEVVVYCRSRYCVLAHDAVRLLTSRGHTARRLEDGMLEWRLAGLPVVA